MKKKILYLWDLADTLFNEEWNKSLTGFDSFEEYAASYGVTTDMPRQFEECFKEPYQKGEMFNMGIKPGFAEVLSYAKNNETFSTGFQEQVKWRADYISPRVGFDVTKFFKKLNSTFDFGETNIKTEAMLRAYLESKYKEDSKTVVYTDDKLKNGELFKSAAEKLKQKHADFGWRFYHILNDQGGIRKKDWYWQVGCLRDIVESEKKLN